jgi:16S rRNA (uracil1498-N3)-methyltransferase
MSRRSRITTLSNTYRFFVAPGSFHGSAVQVDDPDLARQLASVLRLGPGDRVMLLDGLGWQYLVRIERLAGGQVVGAVEMRQEAGGEPHLRLTLYTALMRPERFEWLLQKGTELGVSAFVPVVCERSAHNEESGMRRLARWERIVREAAEQCRRAYLPRVSPPQQFGAACAQAADAELGLILWEGEGARSLRQALRARDAALGPPQTISVVSGPEGGLSDDELRAARAAGLEIVSLGPRTLRAETAPLAATAAVLYDLGELE